MSMVKSLRKKLIIFPIVGAVLLSPISVQAKLGDSVLKEGIVHEDVKDLKEHLIDLNFFSIEENEKANMNFTYYDELTVQAVKDFQNFYGLEEDGIFGSNTFETLQQVSEIAPLEYERKLELDVEGEDVKNLQEKLKIMGFLDVDEVDTIYGPKTKEAVTAFQTVYKLQVDGIAGADTIEAINNALNGSRRIRRPAVSRGGARSVDNNIIATAKQYIGTPYRSAGTTPAGFDCSGFTQFVYKKHGISVPRSSLGQAGFGTKLSKSELRTGDLVIFSNTYRKGPSHVGIYIGNGDFIHSSSSRGITIDNINSGYYLNHYSYGRRVY